MPDHYPGDLAMIERKEMKNKTVDRRNFLKGVGSLLVGAVCLRVTRLFGPAEQSKENKIPAKEAKYYTQADHLAG